jgi:hypothetical protein
VEIRNVFVEISTKRFLLPVKIEKKVLYPFPPDRFLESGVLETFCEDVFSS